MNRSRNDNLKQDAPRRASSVWKTGLLALLSILLVPIAGYCSISIMPMEANLQATPEGSRLSNDIEVYNGSDEALHVTGSLMDWTMNQAGHKQFLEPNTTPHSCASWIRMNPEQFILAPKQSVRVRYSVTPPTDLKEDHWAMIFFTTRQIPKANAGIGLNVNTRIGCKVFVGPTLAPSPVAKIADMNLFSLASQVQITIENPGVKNIRLKGKVEVRGADGQLAAIAAITPLNALVLTGTKREVQAQLDKPLPPGTYTVKAVIDYGAKQLLGGELKAVVTPSAAPTAAIPAG